MTPYDWMNCPSMIKFWNWFNHFLFGCSFRLKSYSGYDLYGRPTEVTLERTYCGKLWKVFKCKGDAIWRDNTTAKYIDIDAHDFIERQLILNKRNVTN